MIKLSKKWDYAIKTVVFLWKNKEDIFKISQVSETLDISESLLRRIIADLEKSGIIKSIKWRNWWVKIGKSLGKITLFDVLLAIWEDLFLSDCTAWKDCEKSWICHTEDIYWLLQKWLNGILKVYSLDKIVK